MFCQDASRCEYFRTSAWNDPDAFSHQLFEVGKTLEYDQTVVWSSGLVVWNDPDGALGRQLSEVWKSSFRLGQKRQLFKIW